MLSELAFLHRAGAINDYRVGLVSHLGCIEADSEPHIRRTLESDRGGCAVVCNSGVNQFPEVTRG